MNKTITFSLVLLIGLTISKKIIEEKETLSDISTLKEQTTSYYDDDNYYYDFSWIYYVFSAIFFCIAIYFIVKMCRNRNASQNTVNIPLVSNQYNQSYVPSQINQPNIQNQPYTSQPYTNIQPNQGYDSNMIIPNQQYYQAPNTVANCAICNQPLEVPNALDPINSGKIILQCSHSFHYGCISNAMKTQYKCPICQMVIEHPLPQPQEDLDVVPIATQDQA